MDRRPYWLAQFDGNEKYSKQDVRANIWCAVLAVRGPVVNVVIGWLDPEVLLSLLRKIKSSDYTAKIFQTWIKRLSR